MGKPGSDTAAMMVALMSRRNRKFFDDDIHIPI